MAIFEGERAADGGRYLVIASRFNRWLTEKLLDGARTELVKLGLKEGDIDTAWVPGAFELPQAAGLAAAGGKYRAVICVGAVLKGDTSHHEHIASACANGIQQAALSTGVPVTFGVITADTFEQARDRARPGGGRNIGADAATAAVEMASLFSRMGKGK